MLKEKISSKLHYLLRQLSEIFIEPKFKLFVGHEKIKNFKKSTTNKSILL